MRVHEHVGKICQEADQRDRVEARSRSRPPREAPLVRTAGKETLEKTHEQRSRVGVYRERGVFPEKPLPSRGFKERQPVNKRLDSQSPKDLDESGRRWMLAFQAGDAAAFDNLVIEYQSSVLHFLFRYLKDRHRAEDLTQEVFIRVFRSRERYRPTARFRTWLFTIALRLAMNEIRGLRRRRRVFGERVTGRPESDASTWKVASEPVDHREVQPIARLEEAELSEVLGRLIQALPPGQRAAVLLSRGEELSYREVAEVLGVTAMAVKSLLMRARETLRAGLRPYLDGKASSARSK
jgi:RNA polymerase sigma-70 factor (ECF subfamily)